MSLLLPQTQSSTVAGLRFRKVLPVSQVPTFFVVPAEPPRGELFTNLQDDTAAGTRAMAVHLTNPLQQGLRIIKPSRQRGCCRVRCVAVVQVAASTIIRGTTLLHSAIYATAVAVKKRKRHWRSDANLALHAELKIRHVLGFNAIYQPYWRPSSPQSAGAPLPSWCRWQSTFPLNMSY